MAEARHPELKELLTADLAVLTEVLRLDSTADRTIENWVDGCRTLTMEDPEKGVAATARLIEIAECAASRRLRARVFSAHCHALSYAGRMKQAIAISERAIEEAAASGDTLALAEACMTAVQSHNVLGLREEALTLASKAGEIFMAAGDLDRSATAIMLAGVVLRMLDRPEEALERFGSALMIVGPNPSLRAQLASNKAEAQLDLGCFADAKVSFENALEGFRSCGQDFGEAIVAGNLADLASRRGDLREALGLFLDASSRFRSASDEAEAARLEAEAAELFLAIGDSREAIYRLPPAIETLHDAGMQTEHARALAAFGVALGRSGELDAALCKLEESEQLSRDHGQQHALIRARSLRGGLLLSLGHAQKAVSIIRDTINMQPLDPTRARLLLDLSMALASAGDLAESRIALELASGLTQKLGLADVDTSLSAVRAMHARLSGDLGIAREHLDRAMKGAESRMSQFAGDRLRATALGGARLVSEEGIRLALAANDPALAYGVSEHAHARTLRESVELSGRSGRSNQLIALEGDISATLTQIEDARAAGRKYSHILRMREHLRELERRHGSLEIREQSQTKRPGQSSILPTLSDIQASMPVDATAIVLADTGEHFARLALTPESVTLTELEVSVKEEAKRCGDLLSNIDRALVRLTLGRSVPAELDRHIDDDLEAFGSLLFDGAGEVLARRNRLVVVLPNELARLPLSALRVDGKYLVELCTPVIAPSLSWSAAKVSTEQPCREGLVAFGIADEMAQSIDAELDAIAFVNPSSIVFRNSDATFDRLEREVTNCGVLHLACHGEYSASDPMGSRLKFGDGWVPARRIAGLNFNDAEVVLGGCETGAVDTIAGEQFGLIRACLLAGARTVIASRWRLSDEAGASIFSELHRSQVHPGESLPCGLSRIQGEAAANGQHPALWGGLFALGSWS